MDTEELVLVGESGRECSEDGERVGDKGYSEVELELSGSDFCTLSIHSAMLAMARILRLWVVPLVLRTTIHFCQKIYLHQTSPKQQVGTK
jgi:hypothetical protein